MCVFRRIAECVYVLESFYEVERERVATLMRAAIGHRSIETVDPSALLRALEVYELQRIDFAEAYLVAQAEASGVGEIVSFDRAIDRAATVTRREPESRSARRSASQSPVRRV
jgi:predicted nucleic-acid-binding protein